MTLNDVSSWICKFVKWLLTEVFFYFPFVAPLVAKMLGKSWSMDWMSNSFIHVGTVCGLLVLHFIFLWFTLNKYYKEENPAFLGRFGPQILVIILYISIMTNVIMFEVAVFENLGDENLKYMKINKEYWENLKFQAFLFEIFMVSFSVYTLHGRRIWKWIPRDNSAIIDYEKNEMQITGELNVENNMKINWWFFAGVVSVPISIIFAIGLSIGYSGTPQIDFALYLSIFGVGLSVAIFAIQQSQGEKIKELITNANSINSEQDRLFKDVREIYANHIVRWVIGINERPNHLQELYVKFIKDKPFHDQQKYETAKTIANVYSRELQIWRPKIETMELVKTFGKSIVDPWVKFGIMCDADTYLYEVSGEGIEELISNHTKRLQDSILIAKSFVQYASKDVQKEFQEKFNN